MEQLYRSILGSRHRSSGDCLDTTVDVSDGKGSLFSVALSALKGMKGNDNNEIDVVSFLAEVERTLVTQSPNRALALFRTEVQGSDFPIADGTELLSVNEDRDLSPTHVVTSSGCVQPLDLETCSSQLPVGFRLRVLSVSGSRALVARDGRTLGYISLGLLSRLQ
jgi:hypothetical protein